MTDRARTIERRTGETEVRLAALDMLAQAEHGQGSLVVAVCGALEVEDMLAAELQDLMAEPPGVG